MTLCPRRAVPAARHEFVYLFTPQYAEGATAANSAPAAMAQPGRGRSGR
ncbi:hypothetical protein [Haloechinothrix halophila]|nr:hypothetical protein [Haloechinothrix halophila]